MTQLYGNKRIWITEYGYETNPPDPIFGVSWAKQAAYLKQAFAIARANPRIDLMLWFLLRDDTNVNGWQSGLITARGKKKPSFARVPATARRSRDEGRRRPPQALLERDRRLVAEHLAGGASRSAHESRMSPGRDGANTFSTGRPRISPIVSATWLTLAGRAAGDVEDAAARAVGASAARDRRVDDVVDVGEVARLLAVAVDRRSARRRRSR